MLASDSKLRTIHVYGRATKRNNLWYVSFMYARKYFTLPVVESLCVVDENRSFYSYVFESNLEEIHVDFKKP